MTLAGLLIIQSSKGKRSGVLGNNRTRAVTSNQIEIIMAIGAKESALDDRTNVLESLLDIGDEGTQHDGIKSRLRNSVPAPITLSLERSRKMISAKPQVIPDCCQRTPQSSEN